MEGFVPEPSEDELREAEAAARARALLDAAITLDESAIKKIPDDLQDEEEGEQETVGETGGETHTSSSAVNVTVGDAESTDKTQDTGENKVSICFYCSYWYYLDSHSSCCGAKFK